MSKTSEDFLNWEQRTRYNMDPNFTFTMGESIIKAKNRDVYDRQVRMEKRLTDQITALSAQVGSLEEKMERLTVQFLALQESLQAFVECSTLTEEKVGCDENL